MVDSGMAENFGVGQDSAKEGWQSVQCGGVPGDASIWEKYADR